MNRIFDNEYYLMFPTPHSLAMPSGPCLRFISAIVLLVLNFLLGGVSAAEVGSTPVLNLTPAERAWLIEHSQIRLAVDRDWAPFEFIDDQKEYRGMAAEYIRLVQERLGIKLSIDKDRSWPEMVEAVKNRNLDVFSLVVKTPQRDEFVNFTKPYLSFPMVITTLADEPFVDGIEALRTRSVAVVKSYASHDLLARNHQKLKLTLTNNVREGLEAVSNGQVDAFVGNLAVVSQVIRETGITNLKISGQTPYRFELRMAVRKDWPELIPILQKTLDSISSQQRDQIYNQWIHVRFQEEIDYRIIMIILGIGILIISIIIIWNRKLKREIAERKAAENAVLERESRLQFFLDSSPVGISLVSLSSNKRLYANPALIEMFGAESEQQLLAIPLIDTYANVDDYHHVRSMHKDEIMPTVEALRRRIDGSTWWGLITRQRVVLDGDDCLVIWYYDITERKAGELVLEKAREEAEKANQAKSGFLSSMSHELRTPLNSILGFSQILGNDPEQPLSEDQQDSVSHILKNGRLLLELINDVLDLSKIEAGEVELSIEDVFLFEIIEEGFSLVAARAEERGIDLFVADGMVDMPTVQADRTRLLQVLVNLLSNAVKYNRADGKVIIGMEEVSGNMLRIAVSDTGEGIPEDKQAELFKPFSRLGAENSGIEGTGIGLVVCEDLIERMGGVIGMESEVGRGSTFWFELPMAEDDRERTVAEANDLVVPDKGVLPGTIGTLLYVEDNPANLVLMEKIVSRIKGLSMISAHTGELGIELARAKRPDIIILDINLPGLNGIEVLKKLRQYDDIRNTPILALSAAATKIDIEKGMEAGFLRYLTKPLVVSEIVDAIRSALGDSHSDNSRSRTNA